MKNTIDEKTVTVSYTGIILDEASRANLLSHVDWMIPKSYKRLAHHMTVNMGPFDTTLNDARLLGESVALVAYAWSMDGKVAAVKVRPGKNVNTVNQHPHITLAVNQAEGKAKDSNDLGNWVPLPMQIDLQGTLLEVECETINSTKGV